MHAFRIRGAFGAALAATVLAVAPSSAVAAPDLVCVSVTSCDGGSIVGSIHAAIVAADDDGDRTTIRIGATPTPLPVTTAESVDTPVDLVGAGSSVSKVRLGTSNPSDVATIQLNDPSSTVSNLGFSFTAGSRSVALDITGTGATPSVFDVDVDGSGAGFDAVGLLLRANANVRRVTSRFALVQTGGLGGWAMRVAPGTGNAVLVEDAILVGSTAIQQDAPGALVLQRSTVRYGQTGFFSPGNGVGASGERGGIASSSVFVHDPSVASTGSSAVYVQGSVTANAASFAVHDSTVVGGEAGIRFSGNDTGTASSNVRGTTFSAVTYPVSLEHAPGNGALSVDIDRSNIDIAAARLLGTGSSITPGPSNVNVDPRFVDAAAGDYRLVGDSPLIDRGNASPAPLASATDRAGLPRNRGVGDIGAYEYVGVAPTVAAATSAASTTLGSTVTLSAVGGDDDGEAGRLTYAWSFDGAASATGPVALWTPTSLGVHTATVIATDPAGRTASASVTVEATSPPAPPTDPTDRTRPALRVVITRIARATILGRRAPTYRARHTVDEPARVTTTFVLTATKRRTPVRRLTLGSVRTDLARAGSRVAAFTPTRVVRGRTARFFAARRGDTYRLQVRVVARDRAGNQRTTTTQRPLG
jgi:hypothetical protein